MYSDFKSLEDALIRCKKGRVMAIAAAEDRSVIEGALLAYGRQIVCPIFVGDVVRIREILSEMGQRPSDYEIVDSAERGPGQTAVDIVRSGKADLLMKGFLETRDLLRPVVNRENGLSTGRKMSHLAVFKLPNYPKLIANTDGGMIPYPTLEDKKSIIENAVASFRAIGYKMPKVAVLSTVEKVNPKIRETVEAAELAEMNRRGEIADCIVRGPLSYDVAMSAEIARHKGVDCPESGDFDILISPDMNAGNILSKSWTITAGAVMAGIIVGARVPIVLNSRSASAEEKFCSIVLAALTAAGTAETEQ